MHLSKYMAENGLKDEEVADAIGKTRVSVTRYRNGKIRPSWETAQKISDFTHGQVALGDWIAEAAE